MMSKMIHLLQKIVWGPGMLLIFLTAGILFTVRSGCFQIRGIPIWVKNTVGTLRNGIHKKDTEDKNSITQFQSFCTALAAALGTGNITGVATAILYGGPGSIFWMWISAFLGMMTGYAENYLGNAYRYKNEEGKWMGGAMVYMERGLGCRPLAIVFAICCLGASLGMGNMVQGNSMAKGLEEAFHISPFVSGSLCMILTAVLVAGGIHRVARLTEKLVPIMALLYILGAASVLWVYRGRIGGAFAWILREAFQRKAPLGGVAGYGMHQAMRMGIARGIFSNEAGLGSSVMAHAETSETDPKVQGMWGILEIFIDTIIVCTVTALVILASGVYHPEIVLEQISAGVETMDGTTLTGMAFSTVLPWGRQFLAVAAALFAFATILGWSYFGEQTAGYLAGKRGISCYRVLFISLILPGCLAAPSVIWELSDIFNGWMAVPNLLALLFLCREVQYR